MSTVDPDEFIGVREFFSDMGVTDDAVLNTFMVVMGVERPRHELEAIRTTVLHSCYRNADALRVALGQFFGPNEPEGRACTSALVNLRTFNEVPLRDEARKYGGNELDFSIQELTQHLGETVPEWFFPAACLLARKTRRGDVNQTDIQRFEAQFERLMVLWGYNQPPSRMPLTTPGRVAWNLGWVFDLLSNNRDEFSWVLPSQAELDAAQN